MGIQINGQTDTISATDGSFTISGASGDLVGNLTGNVTGNLTGTASTASNLAAGATLTIGAGSTSAPSLAPSGDSNTGIFFPSADTIAFAEGGAEASRIDSSGRLLVGTTSSTGITPPGESFTTAARLQVSGSSANGAASLQATDTATLDVSLGGSVSLTKHRSDDAAVPNGWTLGSVYFNGYDSAALRVGAMIQAEADNDAWASGDCPTRLLFHTTADAASSPTERMRITSNGTVVIGDTTTSATSGTGHKFNNSTPSLPLFTTVADDNIPAAHLIEIYNANATYNGTRFAVRLNGGIENYQSNDVNLCDEREKQDIVDLDSTWDCLKHWELKKFHYITDAQSDPLRYGVIAQQVAPHCPEVITDWIKQEAAEAVLDEDGNEIEPAREEIVRMGVKEQQMMWMAIKALQEAQTRIETLEAEVAALKAQ